MRFLKKIYKPSVMLFKKVLQIRVKIENIIPQKKIPHKNLQLRYPGDISVLYSN